MVCVLGIDCGLRNLALCKTIVTDDTSIDIDNWLVLDVLGDKNAKKISIEEATRLIIESLQQYDAMYDGIDIVAIESQPVGRAATGSVRNKVISHVIQTFFEVRGIQTTFLNPKNKMCRTFISEHTVEQDAPGDENTKKRYAAHKKAAVTAVHQYVPEKWSEFWNSLKKKDDAADSFLISAIVGRNIHAKKNKKRKR